MSQPKMQIHKAPNLWFNVSFTLVSEVLFHFSRISEESNSIKISYCMLMLEDKEK